MKKYSFWQYLGVMGTLACIVIFIRTPSFPTPDKLVVFLTFVFMIFGQALAMLARVLPFAAILLVYESFRGMATYLNANVNWLWMPGVDRLMSAGHLPTAVLQSWWWHGQVQWYDFMFYVPYMLHFVLPFTLALIIWKLRESEYWRYITAFMVVSFAGFITYVAFPAAPPWMASDHGLIEPITRVSSHVWSALGVHDFPSVYNKIAANPVAAVPSLHAAYATLVALFVIVLFKSKWRFLAIIYPLLIYIGTIYQGEHYAIDEILGALYAVAAYLVAPYVLRLIRKAWKSVDRRLRPLIRPLLRKETQKPKKA